MCWHGEAKAHRLAGESAFNRAWTTYGKGQTMHTNLAGRRNYYDLRGPESGQVVCFTHSLASDGGMWAEQMPPLLSAGYRVLRLDMRGHGGSDPVGGDYTMAQLADDVAASLDSLGISRVQY